MRSKKAGAWTLLTDGLLLFLALVSTAFGVVTVYRMEVISSALWAGAALITPVALALVHPRKYNILYLLSVFALWLWGLWRLWEPLVWGGTRLQCDVVNTISRKIPTVVGLAPLLELPDEVWTQAATLWLLMVGSVYALVLALLLCCLRRSTPVVLWMLLPILPALCVTEAPDRLPMAGMLAVWLTLALTSLTAGQDPAGTARVRLVALVCVLAALSILAEKLPTQGTAQPLWAADIREAVINEASRGDFSALLTRWSGWMGAGSTEYMNLLGNSPAQTGRVALRVEMDRSGKYYLRGYSADVYTGRRWEPMGRAAKEELEAIRETGVEPLLMLGEKVREDSSYYTYHSYQNGEFTTYQGDDSIQMTVENVAAPGGCIYYPYALARLPENAQFGGDSHLERTGAVWEHTFSFYQSWRRADRWYSLAQYDRFGRPIERGEDPYRDFVYEHELQVPGELRPILEDWLRENVSRALWADLGIVDIPEDVSFFSLEDYIRYTKAYYVWIERVWEQWMEESEEKRLQGWDEDALGERWRGYYKNGAPTQEDLDAVTVTEEDLEAFRWYNDGLLDLIVEGLAETTRYDRNTPAPPAGRDYVDWFLNGSKQGYCMHYATAATLLLRTAGIPARYVSGYLVSIPWRGGSVEVTDHAAHAWVEVYIDGAGWYPLEATPGFQSNAMGDIPSLESGEVQASAAPGASSSPVPTATASQGPDEEDGEDDQEETVTPSAAPTPSQAPGVQGGPGGAEGKGLAIPAWVWHTLGILLVAVLGILGRRYLLKRRREKLWGKDRNAAVLWTYACYERLKPWGGRESEELTALAEKARFSQHILSQEERVRAVELLEGEARRVLEELPGWKRAAFRVMWGSGQ